MRTLVFILGGLGLWAMMHVVVRFSGISMKAAFLAFAILWCAFTCVNLWVGVARAGYSTREELPIFLLIFLLPVGIAWVVKWRFPGPR